LANLSKIVVRITLAWQEAVAYTVAIELQWCQLNLADQQKFAKLPN